MLQLLEHTHGHKYVMAIDVKDTCDTEVLAAKLPPKCRVY